MSWDEVYKLNSDFINEPLNFNNYINDISTFKENSYVLDRSNENLFLQLVTRSLTMYGHKAIHEVIYNRLDDAECDQMIHLHPRLGEAFNGFYKTDIYNPGPIDEVLKTITSESYNALEWKLRTAVNRYINEKTEGDGACAWLSSLFPDVAGLSEHTSIQSILEDKNYFDSIFFERKMEQIDGDYTVVTTELNTTLRYILCNAFSAVAFADSMDREVYKVFVRECATSTVTSLALIENILLWDKEEEFFGDEDICAIIAENKEAIWGIAASPEAFHAFLSSTTMLDAIGNSEVGFQAVVDGFELAGKLGSILTRLKTHADGIDEEIAEVTEDFDIINGVAKMKETIDACKGSVDNLLSKVDAFVGNMDSVWGNREFVFHVLSNGKCVLVLKERNLTNTVINLIINGNAYSTKVSVNASDESHETTVNNLFKSHEGKAVVYQYSYRTGGSTTYPDSVIKNGFLNLGNYPKINIPGGYKQNTSGEEIFADFHGEVQAYKATWASGTNAYLYLTSTLYIL